MNKKIVKKNLVKKPIKKQVKKLIKKRVKKPIKKQVKKPIKKRVKKPIKKQVKKPIKKLVKKPNKKNLTKRHINSINEIVINKSYKNSEDLRGDIFVVIFTYERYKKICNLLFDINKNIKNYKIIVNIFDDGSKKEQKLGKYNFPINYYKFKYNHGKRKWYKMHEYIMNIIKKTNFKYYIYLADDMRLVNNFFEKSINKYNSIKDYKKICLNLNNDRNNLKQWTQFKRKKYNKDIWLSNWVDMCFISKKNLFKILNFRFKNFKETKKKGLSSGVGKYISKYMYKRKYKMYLVNKSLVIHDGNNDSKMNKKIRKRKALISKL